MNSIVTCHPHVPQVPAHVTSMASRWRYQHVEQQYAAGNQLVREKCGHPYCILDSLHCKHNVWTVVDWQMGCGICSTRFKPASEPFVTARSDCSNNLSIV